MPQESLFGREEELKALDKLLSPCSRKPHVEPVGKIVVLAGPKNSGKTALIREFRRRQKAGEYKGASSYVDVGDPALLHKLKDEHGDDWKSATAAIAYLQRRVDSITPEPYYVYLERGDSAEADYASCFPSLFIDDADALLSIFQSGRSSTTAMDLISQFLARVPKQEGAANIVLASSSDWIFRLNVFKHVRLEVLYVGDLSVEKAKAFLLDSVGLLQSHKELVEENWEEIFYHVGGAIADLCEVARLVNTSGRSGDGFREGWEQLKRSMWVQARPPIVEAFFPKESAGHRWSDDEWATVTVEIAMSSDGHLSHERLAAGSLGNVHGLNSMIEFGLLHFRPYSTCGQERVANIEDWPGVTPISRTAFLVIKDAFASPTPPPSP